MALLLKNLSANAGDRRDTDSWVGKRYCLTPGSGRSPGGGPGNPLQYSCLENPMDRGVWRAIVHGVARVGHDLTTKSDLVTKQQH